MKLLGVLSTAILCLTLGAAALVYAQEQHDQQEEQKAKPAQEENKAQPAKPAQQEEKGAQQQEKNTKPEEKNAQQEKGARPEEKNAQQPMNTKPEEKNAQQPMSTKPEEREAQQAKPAGGNGGGRIPADRYKANFGREHTFHVSQGDYGNRRFQYGGYWFGFAGAWPSNWLYTQDVYVVEIDGVYYLCNPMYPGVNVELNVSM